MHDNYPPYRRKIAGANSPSSRIRSREKQQIAMVDTLASILKKDPELAAGAQVLLDHEQLMGLLPEEDALDWEA